MKRILLVILFSLISFINLFPQKINYYKSVKIDTTKVISEKEFVEIADKFFRTNYAYLSQEKFFVNQSLKKLETEKDSLKIAKGLSSTAVLFTGTGESALIPIVFSSKAASLFPKDTQIVNNFGAVLRMMDSIKTSVKILLYAKSLCPDAPVILTNLANSLFELFDDKSAEYFYQKALKINPDYALARHGLVDVYFKRKDLQKALEEMFKGLRGIYSQSLGKAQNKVKYQDSYSPPPEPFGDSPQDNGSNSGDSKGSNSDASNEQLKLPDFPNWSDETAFINDKSIEKLKKEVGQLNSEASDGLFKEVDALKGMNEDQRQEWYNNKFKSGKILSDKNELGMELLEEYIDDELKKVNKDYIKKNKDNNQKFEKSLKQIDGFVQAQGNALNESGAASPEAGMSNVMKYADLLAERCKRTMNLIQDTFSDWKKTAQTRHNKYNDLLVTYWTYCEQYLNQTYDKNEFEKLDSRRKMFVFSNYTVLAMDYSINQLGFAAMNMTALATINGECPQSPPRPEITSKEMSVKSPKKNAPPCPFENKKFKVGLGACSFGLDCESVEAECGEGVIGAVKWNYKKKEMTLFAGVGAKANFGFAPGSSEAAKQFNEGMGGELEAKGGFQITFNKDCQVIDGGVTGEVSAKGNLGALSAGSNYSVTATAATGINDEFTNEYSGTVFK